MTFDKARTDLPPLHALICNAGIQFNAGLVNTEDGYETTWAVNHLGHFLLVLLLLDKIQKPGRIVVVSSGTHDPLQKSGMPDPIYKDAETIAHAK